MDSHGFLGFLVEDQKSFFSDQVLWGSNWILAVAWQWWQAALAVLGLLEDLGKGLFAEFLLCSACGSAVDSACVSAVDSVVDSAPVSAFVSAFESCGSKRHISSKVQMSKRRDQTELLTDMATASRAAAPPRRRAAGPPRSELGGVSDSC